MNVVPPPMPADLTSESTTGSNDLRIYQTWKGSNTFFLRGRFVFGPDVGQLVVTIFLIVAPVTIFCVFVARKLIDDLSHYLGIPIMAVAVIFTSSIVLLLLLTSGRDPGIIPRNSDPSESEGYDASADSLENTPHLRLPRLKEVEVNGITVKVKYCDTCKLYRPPRSSHCSICDNCVERFDHHCPWVGQCIGLRNYQFFFMFIFLASLLCLFVFSFCWIYIWKIMDSKKTSLWRAMIKTPASIVLIVYTFIAMWFVGGLTIFHLYLMTKSRTTYENFRYRYDRLPNPYNKGAMQYFKEIFCTGIPPPKINFRAKVPMLPVSPDGTVVGGSPNTDRDEDIEMGRKAVGLDHTEGERKGGGESEEALNTTTTVDEGDCVPTHSRQSSQGNGTHSRHSSRGKKSGRWETSLGETSPASKLEEAEK